MLWLQVTGYKLEGNSGTTLGPGLHIFFSFFVILETLPIFKKSHPGIADIFREKRHRVKPILLILETKFHFAIIGSPSLHPNPLGGQPIMSRH